MESNKCVRCSEELNLIGTENFRTGGSRGGWKLLFGEWAELGEELIPLEMWACPKCRRVEFKVPLKR